MLDGSESEVVDRKEDDNLEPVDKPYCCPKPAEDSLGISLLDSLYQTRHHGSKRRREDGKQHTGNYYCKEGFGNLGLFEVDCTQKEAKHRTCPAYPEKQAYVNSDVHWQLNEFAWDADNGAKPLLKHKRLSVMAWEQQSEHRSEEHTSELQSL